MSKLDGKVAVIIGATSGMGEAIARLFAKEGALVVFAGRRNNLGTKIAEEIRSKGGIALFVRTDATDEEQVQNLFDVIKKTYGRLDIAVNALGSNRANLVKNTPAQDFDFIFKTNVYSVIYCMKREINMMLSSGSGVIVNISSISSIVVNNYQGPYCASKAGIDILTKCAAQEVGPRGIRVCTINPGLIATDLTKKFTQRPDVMDDFMYKVPLRRVGTTDDIAKAALFLCSDDASYITASSLFVDGGTASEGFPGCISNYKR